jgi:PAS domain S-box-containing protein
MRILLVEDNSDHRELMRLALTGHDSTWEVEAVASGEEALRLLLGGAVFDLVFLDYSLPGRDGLEVLEEIRRGEAPPPVVVVTGRGDEQVAVKAMKGGAYDYVVKGAGYLQRLPVVAQRAVEAHQLSVERQRAEKALQESEERLRTIVEASLDAIIAVNTKGRLVLFNGAAQELFQYSEEEALNQPVDILLREEICDIHQERLVRFLKKGVGRCGHIGSRMEKLFRRKDGSLFEAEASMSGGRLDGLRLVVLAIHDITSRKQAEEVLRESEERYHRLVENAPEVIYSLSAEDTTITSLNSAFERITGWSRAEWLGKPFMSLIHPDDLGLAVETFQQVLRGEVIQPYELRILSRSGEYISGEFTSVPNIEKGKVIGEFGIARDITERKRAEDALRRSEENFRRSLDDSPLGTRIVTVEGETIYANRAILDIYDFDSIEELKTTPVEKRYTPESYAEFRIRREKRRQDVDTPSEYTISIVRKNGEVRYLQVFRKEILWDDKRQFQVIYQDSTERKQAEERIHTSLREKEILLREIHHRVKNNMQVISSLLDLQASSSKNPELIAMFHESQSRIQAMALVHEKLYGSKDFARIDLTGYVRTLSQDLFQSYKINPEKIDLIVQTDGAVYVDISKAIPCGLILNELISNALQHAFPRDRHGELRIIIRETKNTEIEIVVRDNGLSLPDDVDIHQPRTVGLHLVNGLVKNQLDGQIEVIRDAGTEFRIKFPL